MSEPRGGTESSIPAPGCQGQNPCRTEAPSNLINGFREGTASAVPLELRKSWASAAEASVVSPALIYEMSSPSVLPIKKTRTAPEVANCLRMLILGGRFPQDRM